MTNPLVNRPRGLLGPQGIIIPDSFIDNAFRGEYDASGNLIYKGFATPGSDEAAVVWQIAKLTYDGTGNILTIVWPQNSQGRASKDYEFAWSLRASYTYS